MWLMLIIIASGGSFSIEVTQKTIEFETQELCLRAKTEIEKITLDTKHFSVICFKVKDK